MQQWNVFPVIAFGPVVEHSYPGAFLTETPEMAYINNRAAKVPWINGFTRDEMVYLTSILIQDEAAVSDINNNFDVAGPVLYELFRNTSDINIETARQVWQFYMGNETFRFDTRHAFARVREIF